MSETESKDDSLLEEVVRKIVHDFRGPMINIRGFSDQLNEGVAEILALLEANANDVPEGLRDRLMAIVEEDITPGLTHLVSSINRLDSRVDSIIPESNSTLHDLKKKQVAENSR